MSAFALKLIAMITMLIDHTCVALSPDQLWMRCIGRLAFPIFAFQLAEGYQKTHNKTKYALRLFIFALLAEIPFDLTVYDQPFYWEHQNILWTLLLGLLTLAGVDRVLKNTKDTLIRATAAFCIVFASFVAAQLLCLDYGGFGLLMIFLFYILRNRHYALQIILVLVINCLIGGTTITVQGAEFPMQFLATISMIPICLYKGKQGPHGRAWTWFCYAFYPLHLLLLFSLKSLLTYM